MPLTSSVSVTFNEAIDPAQNLAALFKLAPSDAPAQTVAGTVTLDDGARTLTFDPTSDLEENTTYTAVVSGQRDASGNAQANVYNWSFKSFVTPGQGTVVVTVLNSLGIPLAGAEVELTGGNGPVNSTAGLDGRAVFKAVPLGSVSVVARDPALGLRGRASGTLSFAGQSLGLSVRTIASGVVKGAVFRHGGTTPVAGAEVRVRTGAGQVVAETTTGADGGYIADFVPVGSFTVEVFDPATEDRGLASNQLSGNGETRTINVTLNGLGRVKVTVRDAADHPVAGAEVRLTSQTPFGGTLTGTSGPDGIATFEKVLAGGFNASATDPSTQLSGTQNGTLAAGGSTDVIVKLRPAGTIQGTIFAPDGTTAAAGVTVRLRLDGWYTEREAQTSADGAYRFESVPTGNYVLEVSDASNRVRARSATVSLTQNGELLTRDLTLAGVGTVTGRVLRPDNTFVPNQSVSVRSHAPGLGGFYSAKTDAQGVYRVTGVLVGSFTASATISGQQLQGETTKQLARDGEEVTADIKLINNAINLPVNRWDGNNLYYDVQSNGSIGTGSHGVFGYNWESVNGAFKLVLVSGGSEVGFTGSNIGSVSQGGRAFTVKQNGLAGLDVTRKVFVPGDGYFARFVELLSNPTASPVTVDVRVVSNRRVEWWTGQPRIVSTSSGDDTLNVASASSPDRWVMIDDDFDVDPFELSSPPATAFVFDGAGAPEKVGAAAFGGSTGAELSYEWRQVTIQPGQTVAYLHFGVQQLRQEAARVAATRLAQLPPEALVGLGDEEIAAIKNFAVPADGMGAVVPLPPLDGKVSGRLLASDGTTAVPNSYITLKSKNPLYGRAYSTFTDQSGGFSFVSHFDDGDNPMTIPADAYTLSAQHPVTQVKSPTTDGAFADGSRESAQDVRFNGTAIVRGTVRRHTGAVITQGSVRLWRGDPGYLDTSVNVGADGSYVITGVPANGFQLKPFMAHAQGTSLSGPTVDITTTADGVLTVDLPLDPTGVVSGIVRTAAGQTAAGVSVQLTREGGEYFARSAGTDASGRYTLSDVPPGVYTVRAYEPATGMPTAVQVSVAQDQTTAQDFTLAALGQVRLQVNLSNGAPAAGARVTLQVPALSQWFEEVGYTDSLGRLTINNIPAGVFNLRAFHPATHLAAGNASGTVTTQGQSLPITISLPGVGSVGGVVRYANGTLAPNTHIQLYDGQEFLTWTNADGAARYSFAQVPAGRQLTLLLFDPTEWTTKEVPFQVGADGEALTLDVMLAARATLRVTARYPDGSPFVGGYIELRRPGSTSFFGAGNTNSSGQLLIQSVPEGQFTVRALQNNVPVVSVDGAITTADHGLTLDLSLTIPNPGSIEGKVRAGDGQTPIKLAGVLAFDPITARLIAHTQTDAEGFFRLPQIAPSANGYRVAVVVPSSFTSSDQVVQFNQTRDTIVLDYTIPVGIVKGRVSYRDGAPVQNPRVEVEYTDPNGSTHFWNATATDADGNYTLIGEVQGSVLRLTAEDQGNLSTSVSVTIDDVTTPKIVDIQMPPTGSITGIVRDAADTPVPGARVILQAAEQSNSVSVNADAQGVYRFEQVPLGTFTLQADESNNLGVAALLWGVLSQSGEVVTLDATLPAVGDVTGTVFDSANNPAANARVSITGGGLVGSRSVTADAQGVYRFARMGVGPFEVQASHATLQSFGSTVGMLEAGQTATAVINLTPTGSVRGKVFSADGTPLANAQLRVENYDHAGPRGFFVKTATTDSTGGYEVAGVEAGNVRVYATDPNDLKKTGVADGVVTVGQTASVDVTTGNAANVWNYYFELVGTDGFLYDVDCDGSLGDGGIADGSLSDAYDGAYSLKVNNRIYPCLRAARLGADGREGNFPAVTMSGLKVTRAVFIPQSGGFARYLDTLTNPTDVPITAMVSTESFLGPVSATRLVVAPSETGQKFAVTDEGGCCSTALAHVFGGEGARASSMSLFGNTRSFVFTRWTITVPPGGSVSLMHFAVQRGATDAAGARAQAEALVNLTDPHMLDGLTAEEKARVINFNLPQN